MQTQNMYWGSIKVQVLWGWCGSIKDQPLWRYSVYLPRLQCKRRAYTIQRTRQCWLQVLLATHPLWYTYTHTHTLTHSLTHTHTHWHILIYTHISWVAEYIYHISYIHVYTHTHTHSLTHTHVHVYTYIYIYILYLSRRWAGGHAVVAVILNGSWVALWGVQCDCTFALHHSQRRVPQRHQRWACVAATTHRIPPARCSSLHCTVSIHKYWRAQVSLAEWTSQYCISNVRSRRQSQQHCCCCRFAPSATKAVWARKSAGLFAHTASAAKNAAKQRTFGPLDERYLSVRCLSIL